jgi:nucleoside-diphosphate-sugar epimerase
MTTPKQGSSHWGVTQTEGEIVRVFVAGASGAIGSRLGPQLIDAGHEVIGTHNSPASAELLRTLGARPVKLDLLDAGAVRKAVLENEPEAIVHEATALANVKFARNMDKVTAGTSELRTKGTDALLAAAREAGVRRFVGQSVAAFSRYAREGGAIKTEGDPLDPTPARTFQRAADALAYLEQAVTDFGGIALRYRAFYGAANDGTLEPVRKRQFPIVGDGGGIWSWIHLDDAAAATFAPRRSSHGARPVRLALSPCDACPRSRQPRRESVLRSAPTVLDLRPPPLHGR